jgi:hypothetical protein
MSNGRDRFESSPVPNRQPRTAAALSTFSYQNPSGSVIPVRGRPQRADFRRACVFNNAEKIRELSSDEWLCPWPANDFEARLKRCHGDPDFEGRLKLCHGDPDCSDENGIRQSQLAHFLFDPAINDRCVN